MLQAGGTSSIALADDFQLQCVNKSEHKISDAVEELGRFPIYKQYAMMFRAKVVISWITLYCFRPDICQEPTPAQK